MDTLHSAAQAAQSIGSSHRTVTRLCSIHGLGRRIGRTLCLSDSDLSLLRQLFHGRAGNPNMVSGNDLWRRRKNSGKS